MQCGMWCNNIIIMAKIMIMWKGFCFVLTMLSLVSLDKCLSLIQSTAHKKMALRICPKSKASDLVLKGVGSSNDESYSHQYQRCEAFYTDSTFDKSGKRLSFGEVSLREAILDVSNIAVVPTCRGNNFVKPTMGPDVSSQDSCGSADSYFKPFFLNDHPGYEVVLQKLLDSQETLLVYLGEQNGKSFFLLDSPTLADELQGVPELLCESLRKVGDMVAEEPQAALLAYARGLAAFHRASGFCPTCGAPTKLYKAGAGVACTSCRYKAYPRLDPAVITLVVFTTATGEEFALMGKKRQWKEGMYSCLSGFAEIGESLEECLAREVLEESGVRVAPGTVRYLGTQPWPFPHSFMVGYFAEAAARNLDGRGLPAIDFDADELEDVRWFAKPYVQQQLREGGGCPGEFCIPRRASLANRIIRLWAFGDGGVKKRGSSSGSSSSASLLLKPTTGEQ